MRDSGLSVVTRKVSNGRAFPGRAIHDRLPVGREARRRNRAAPEREALVSRLRRDWWGSPNHPSPAAATRATQASAPMTTSRGRRAPGGTGVMPLICDADDEPEGTRDNL